jgi:hypothetical protein
MVEPLRHRQTKGAETDMLDLTPPRHVSTLPTPARVRYVAFAQIAVVLCQRCKRTKSTLSGSSRRLSSYRNRRQSCCSPNEGIISRPYALYKQGSKNVPLTSKSICDE